ncbi:MAG: tRNA (guanosine(37)-N1)-methyltransferase TrmD [Candidatus Helarchaeota archaeon]|nr:tRNA (guanosine(37)-N1)-methyltransferase TrmD [Candidatus Helarchaeota archaeon]
MKINIITAFPEFFKSPLDTSIIKKGIEKGKIKIEIFNLRDFSNNKHKRIDDYPYGGGPGMVLMVEPIFNAVNEIKEKNNKLKTKVILLSPQGERLTQPKVREISKEENLILICGHYKGVDERVKKFIDEEISIGDYILSGGELPVLVIIDSVVRLIPGIIGDIESANTDSFETGLLDYPHYTKPRIFMEEEVPSVLLSGDHKKIEEWKERMSHLRTTEKRNDLLES